MIALERADDAHGDGFTHAERIADCEHHIANVRLFGMTESDGG